MHITIINPKGEEGTVNLYMSLLYLGTVLHRAGHRVRILDSQIEDSESILKSLINKTEMVGITAMSDQIAHGVRLSDIVKEKDPHLPVVWGGVHASLFPEQTIRDKSVDYVVRHAREWDKDKRQPQQIYIQVESVSGLNPRDIVIKANKIL